MLRVGAQDVRDRWERITSGSSKDSVVVVHVEVNYIGSRRSTDLERPLTGHC